MTSCEESCDGSLTGGEYWYSIMRRLRVKLMREAGSVLTANSFCARCLSMNSQSEMMNTAVFLSPFPGHFDANGQFIQQLQAQPVAIPVAQNPAATAKEEDKNKQTSQLQAMVQVKEEQNLQTLQPSKQPQLTTLQNATRLKPFQVLPDQHHVQHGAQNVQFQQLQLQHGHQVVAPSQLGVGTVVQAHQLLHAQQLDGGQTTQIHHQQLQQQQQQQQQPQQQPPNQQQPQQPLLAQVKESSVGYTIVNNPVDSENPATAGATFGDASVDDLEEAAALEKPELDKNGKPIKKYPCEFCHGKDFKSRGNLKRHQKDFHASVGSDKITYHCDLCKKDFQNRFNLRRHRLGVHGAMEHNGRTYPCDICESSNWYRRRVEWDEGRSDAKAVVVSRLGISIAVNKTRSYSDSRP